MSLELALDRFKDAPFEIIQRDGGDLGDYRRSIRLAARFHPAPSDVSHSEGKQAFGGEQDKFLSSGAGGQELAMPA